MVREAEQGLLQHGLPNAPWKEILEETVEGLDVKDFQIIDVQKIDTESLSLFYERKRARLQGQDNEGTTTSQMETSLLQRALRRYSQLDPKTNEMWLMQGVPTMADAEKIAREGFRGDDRPGFFGTQANDGRKYLFHPIYFGESLSKAHRYTRNIDRGEKYFEREKDVRVIVIARVLLGRIADEITATGDYNGPDFTAVPGGSISYHDSHGNTYRESADLLLGKNPKIIAGANNTKDSWVFRKRVFARNDETRQFDTTREFVVYDHRQALPAFIIRYKGGPFIKREA